jgi:predicted XRE-type DNA-binding protein
MARSRTKHDGAAPQQANRRRLLRTSRRHAPEPSVASHVTPADGNVFADLGFPPEEAANLKIRSHLMSELRALIQTRQLTQAAAATRLGVSQPRISDLMRGKIDLFTIDALVNMLTHAGAAVRVHVV